MMATHSPVGSSVSCTLTTTGCYHDQLAHCETCATGFTTKWTPQYRQPQTKTETRQNIRCPLDMSRGHRICCHICMYNYMQHTTGAYRLCTHTFPLNTSSGQGRHPLMFSQHAPCTSGTPVFGAPPPLRFTNQLQNRQAPERRHA